MKQPLIAVSTDVCKLYNYLWHAAPLQYLEAAVTAADVFPVLIPCLGDRLDFDGLLATVDGVLITGSGSNVQPSLYGGGVTEASGPYDPARDATTLPLIRKAISHGIPLLAICRGLQELNVALGGTLITDIQERPGLLDHPGTQSVSRDELFAIRHTVTVNPDGCLAGIVGAGQIRVNSLHFQAIDQLSELLKAEAVAEDGVVEAASVWSARAFALGVQWHPEYWVKFDEVSRRLFRSFGDAVRVHAANRTGVGANAD
ncbi:gamma-glutamyl-gamma-aminobutyrate hydrolase family protein [Mesorhizobium sp. M0959]|uniref:gamma-glutamyl-gamma-aminobutyrate hydrolase family protein n=1 Tax=Mesorhizobium sp. M0959 TaxID=2957034 RepID=UPI00333BC76D